MLKRLFNSLNVGKENIDELYDEIEVLREECDSLNDVIRKKDAKINKLYLEIDNLREQLNDKGASIKIDQNLLGKLEQELKNRDRKIRDLELQNKELLTKVVVESIDEKIDKNIEAELFNYKVLVNDYYEARKFESFKKSCEDREILYVEDLETLDFDSLPLTDTKIKNAKLHYEDYKKGNYDIELKTYLLKGDKINKIFFRFRSFVKYCKKSNFNYMIDLDNFNFDLLLKEGFTEVQVEKIKEKLKEYNQLKRI